MEDVHELLFRTNENIRLNKYNTRQDVASLWKLADKLVGLVETGKIDKNEL